jgi:hypothetical protein
VSWLDVLNINLEIDLKNLSEVKRIKSMKFYEVPINFEFDHVEKAF